MKLYPKFVSRWLLYYSTRQCLQKSKLSQAIGDDYKLKNKKKRFYWLRDAGFMGDDNVPIHLLLILRSQKVNDIDNSIKIITGSKIARYAANVK